MMYIGLSMLACVRSVRLFMHVGEVVTREIPTP